MPDRKWQQDWVLWGGCSCPGRSMLEVQRQLGPAGAAARLDALSGLGRSQFTTCKAVMAAMSPLRGRQEHMGSWLVSTGQRATHPAHLSELQACRWLLPGRVTPAFKQEKETPAF